MTPPTSPAPLAPFEAASPAEQAASVRVVSGVQPGLVAAWLLAAIALTVAVLLWQKVGAMQEQLARQSMEAGSQSVEARTLARQADEAVRALSGKLAAVESRVADMTAYRAQLDALAQSVAQARDENLAVELEAAVRLAQDQAQLTGSTEPLLAALRTAERRLARSRDARLAPVARAVARDMERVKSAAVTDTAGLLARIDQLLRQAGDLPLANDVGELAARPGADGASPPAAPVSGAAPPGWWARALNAARAQANALLRVSRIERPEATMLSPEQGFFVREQFKLRLQGARLGLLARQLEAARADLAAASVALGSYFDVSSRRTQSAATLLQQMQAALRSADQPGVEDTLAALGAATASAAAKP